MFNRFYIFRIWWCFLSSQYGDSDDPICDDVDLDGVCDDLDECVGDYDECGVCNGDGIADGVCDCDGNILDCAGEWDLRLKTSGVCNGDGIADGVCDCMVPYWIVLVNVVDRTEDECGV